ncbi:cobalt-precorrin-7 (C(5))-methyltransferase [Methanosphaerula palustris]|uniref:Precorrin-6y C5,15-methyltransferase (Decarboxylating), CbiE subunit n=1 Tax=Methanosphaerula palustris (strain ATCC BAA-1556 / DSM 19958 / E1-9c) TaxID=521011 RepID=B8GJI2_METPE|nr:cobalt-precorrin-7 (C(5))-methyltransferase [Methanosphaerula palustris]ACL17023.1 precorrin-6y C5,15-methyltransferase (decarboxylating), CbiE subunit [Methanosphaerula palustris E1-9c]
MKVVGVGCGPGMLTRAAADAITRAGSIYGSPRAIALAAYCIRKDCPVHEIEDYKALRTLPPTTVVLSTGDPMLAGLGYLGGEVIPGISSLQLAAARIGIPLTRVMIVNAHGKDHLHAIEEVVSVVHHGRIAFLIADPAFSIPALAGALEAALFSCRLVVCADLGYPEEEISSGDTGNPPSVSSGLYVLFAGLF